MKKTILKKLGEVRANTSISFSLIDDSQTEEFITSLIEGIRRYSKLLEKARIQEGKPNSHYVFSIENESNVIQLLGNESLQTSRKIDGLWDCTPKPLGIEVLVSELTERFYNNEILVEENIKNILYKPFVKCIEKNVVTGNYFDKPLFSTVNTITGTKDFDGLLQLVRELKNTTDDGCIIGNTSVINEIIDTVDKESYLNEYLLYKTIEGISVLGSKDYPDNVDDKFLVGFDPNKICLLLTPNLDVRRIKKAGDINSYFQIFGFVNGGDVFNSAIALKE